MNAKFSEVVKQAKHYQAIGQTHIHLFEGPFPWEIAEKVETGGTRRLDISTCIRFSGSRAGLTFSWTFDIEEKSANGKGHYEIAVNAIRDVLFQLPPTTRAAFIAILQDAAASVRKAGKEYQGYADRQFNDAAALERLAAE